MALSVEERELNGIFQIAAKPNDENTLAIKFKTLQGFNAWKTLHFCLNCLEYSQKAPPKNELYLTRNHAIDVSNWHCFRSGTSRKGESIKTGKRFTLRKRDSTNVNCLSHITSEHNIATDEVVVFFFAKHTHDIGMSGLNYLHIDQKLVAFATKKVLEKVNDGEIIRSKYFFTNNNAYIYIRLYSSIFKNLLTKKIPY